ncbi:VOC family protein [Streptomyces parvulus]|uniref:VOC family protein n=1 Tax=Streptomyces parvulus TaxID=146923 RepID=UPI00369E26A7
MPVHNGGPQFPPTPAISPYVECDTQPETDTLRAALTHGGAAGPGGSLVDRFGVTWQILAVILRELLRSGDPSAAGRVLAALHAMTRIDIPALTDAHARARPRTESVNHEGPSPHDPAHRHRVATAREPTRACRVDPCAAHDAERGTDVHRRGRPQHLGAPAAAARDVRRRCPAHPRGGGPLRRRPAEPRGTRTRLPAGRGRARTAGAP